MAASNSPPKTAKIVASKAPLPLKFMYITIGKASKETISLNPMACDFLNIVLLINLKMMPRKHSTIAASHTL